MDIKNEIERLMPGAWSKWLFLGSIALSIGLYKFFPDMPASWLPQSESEKFLIRLLLSGSTLLFGSVSLIINLVHHNLKILPELSDLKKEVNELSNTISDLQATLSRSHTHLNSLEQKLTYSKAEFNTLQQKYSETERLNNDRIFLLNVEHKKEIEAIHDRYKKQSPPDNKIGGWT